MKKSKLMKIFFGVFLIMFLLSTKISLMYESYVYNNIRSMENVEKDFKISMIEIAAQKGISPVTQDILNKFVFVSDKLYPEEIDYLKKDSTFQFYKNLNYNRTPGMALETFFLPGNSITIPNKLFVNFERNFQAIMIVYMFLSLIAFAYFKTEEENEINN